MNHVFGNTTHNTTDNTSHNATHNATVFCCCGFGVHLGVHLDGTASNRQKTGEQTKSASDSMAVERKTPSRRRRARMALFLMLLAFNASVVMILVLWSSHVLRQSPLLIVEDDGHYPPAPARLHSMPDAGSQVGSSPASAASCGRDASGSLIECTGRIVKPQKQHDISSVMDKRLLQHRFGSRLAVVVPFADWQVDRLMRNLESLWTAFPPCQPNAPYSRYIDLILYHDRNMAQSKYVSVGILTNLLESVPQVSQCFRKIQFMSAKLSEQQAILPLSEARMFFKLFTSGIMPQTYDTMLYLDTLAVPCRSFWLDRIYENAATSDEFWIKGSMVRDKTYAPEKLPWAAIQFDGQSALYATGSAGLRSYVAQAEIKFWEDPDEYGQAFEVALARVQHDRSVVDWVEYTERAHLIRHWGVVQHWRGTAVSAADVCDAYPETSVVRGEGIEL
ncbi:hypothetical protein BC831DRAFT_448766 [Entophlyctis helioformis]|nr:hypothetical protein BC831DRAFT_448766 [Entophlyctis helioformis]